MLILLSSCRTQYVAMPEVHSRDSTHVMADRRYDSIYIDRWHTLIMRGDTVWKTDSIYVEKLRDTEVHDTVILVQHDSIPYPVEVVREVPAPIPRWYKGCAWFAILFILYWLLRIAKAVYLRR